MHILKCIICVKEVPRSDMIGHIAEELNYFRFHCNGCRFKTSYSHAIVEHELETSHSKKDIVNQYLDRLCNIVYSDCVLKEKNGIDAVFSRAFQPSAIARTPLQNDVASTNSSFLSSAVSSSTALSETRIRDTDTNNGEWMIVGDRNEHGDAENGGGTSHAPPAKSPNIASRSKLQPVASVAKKSKTPTTATRCRSNSNVGSNCVDMECPSATPTAGEASQPCRRCHCVIPNDYRSHKEHVQKMHADTDDGGAAHAESEITMITQLIKQCFPNAVAVNDFQCAMCGKELRSTSGRRGHVAINHLFVCLACPKRTCAAQFGTMKLLEDHVKLKHKTRDLLTDNEQTILKDTRDDHNAKLKAVMARCFPFPVPSTDDNVDLLLSHSANILRRADEEEEDVDEKETNSHVSAACESESVGSVAPPVIDQNQPVMVTPTRRSNGSSAPRSRRFSSSSDSSAAAPPNRPTPTTSRTISTQLKNIKREIKEEKMEEAKKANKRQRSDSDSNSSSDADQRRLKISRLVDNINIQEAKRRNGFLLNRPLNANKANAVLKAVDKEEDESLSSSSSDDDDEVQRSVPRRVLSKIPARPPEPAATPSAASSNSNGSCAKQAVQRETSTSYGGGGQPPKNLVGPKSPNRPLPQNSSHSNGGMSKIQKNGKRPSPKNAAAGKNGRSSNASRNGKNGGGMLSSKTASRMNNNVSKPKKDDSQLSKRAQKRQEARARNNNNKSIGSGQRHRSPSVKRSDFSSEDSRSTPRDNHRLGRNPDQPNRDVPYREGRDGRSPRPPPFHARSAGIAIPRAGRALLPTPRHRAHSPMLTHSTSSSHVSEYCLHLERQWDGDRRVERCTHCNSVGRFYPPQSITSRIDMPSSSSCRMEYVASSSRQGSPLRHRSMKRETS